MTNQALDAENRALLARVRELEGALRNIDDKATFGQRGQFKMIREVVRLALSNGREEA